MNRRFGRSLSYLLRLKRRKIITWTLILLLAIFALVVGPNNEDLSIYSLDSYYKSGTEDSTDLVFHKKLSFLHSSFGSAVLFLGGLDTNTKQYTFSSKEYAKGGPDKNNSKYTQTVSSSALITKTPVPFIASAGSRLSGDAPTFNYKIEKGDTLSSIANNFGVSLQTLLWENNLNSSERINIGDEISVLPIDGVTHKVKRGDNVTTIANRYKADTNRILNYNGLVRDDIIKIGETLIVPDGVPHIPISSSNAPSTSVHSLLDIPSYFALPARGRVTQGLHLYNAADVGGRNFCNTPIYASAAGTVITAKTGAWHGGYGNYIKISHPNNTVTLYAHNSQNLVSYGEEVSKGQVIALMGSTGNATGCHVHFEVRGAKNPFSQ